MTIQDAGFLLSPGTRLSRLVRSWRERLTPDSAPGLYPSGRRKRAVSQEDMARRIDYSSHWYARLERGDTGIYSDDFLDRTATALHLSASERTMLYLCAVGHEPPATRRSTIVLTEPLRRMVDQQPYPAYIADGAWQVMAFNRQMATWFPWLRDDPEPNVMRWALTSSEARVQLDNWDTDWVPLMLAQMMAAHARHPDNTDLTRVISDVLDANDMARELWAAGPIVHLHSDGDRHRLRVPGQRDVIEIEVMAMTLLRAPGTRLVTLVPCAP